MPDTLTLHEITIECHLGVEEWERAIPQPVWIDLELGIDAAKAAVRDDVQDAIDYAQLVGCVKQLLESKSYHLLETAAEDVASLVLERFATAQVFVRVKKRALPGIEYAAVEITRTVR